jgi:hypothetical protein
VLIRIYPVFCMRPLHIPPKYDGDEIRDSNDLLWVSTNLNILKNVSSQFQTASQFSLSKS